MPRGSRAYGPWQSVIMAGMTGRTCDEALVAYLSATGAEVAGNMPAQWRRGSCHLPVDVALLLADHLGEDGLEATFGPALRARGYKLEPLEARPADVGQAMRQLQRLMGQSVALLAEARDPDSEGGSQVSLGEATALLPVLAELQRQLTSVHLEVQAIVDRGRR